MRASFTRREVLQIAGGLCAAKCLAAGRGQGLLDADGWTIRTADGALSAHYEHILAITKGAAILLTTRR